MSKYISASARIKTQNLKKVTPKNYQRTSSQRSPSLLKGTTEGEQQKTEKGKDVKEPPKKNHKRVPTRQEGKKIANNEEMTHAPW
jgi:hypothetical protein